VSELKFPDWTACRDKALLPTGDERYPVGYRSNEELADDLAQMDQKISWTEEAPPGSAPTPQMKRDAAI